MNSKHAQLLFAGLLLLTTLLTRVNGLYFYMEKGTVKCFKDELVKNTVKSSHIQANEVDL